MMLKCLIRRVIAPLPDRLGALFTAADLVHWVARTELTISGAESHCINPQVGYAEADENAKY